MKKEYLFGITGILIGAIVAGLLTYTVFAKEIDSSKEYSMMSKNGMHMMPDGSKMDNMQDGMTMDGMTEALKGKTGDEFDKEFITQMIDHHEGAVEMAELAKKNAQHQEIKSMAEDIIEAQTAEIKQMKSWGDSWGY